MSNDENISKDLEQEIRETLSERISKTQEKVTTKDQGWTTIMNESTKTNKKQSSRTKMFAIAASILLVAVIGGTVLAVTANGDSKAIKTVDDKDKTPVTKPPQETSSTTTTIPLTPEQQLLNNTISLKKNGNSYDVFDEKGTLIKSLPAREGNNSVQILNSTKNEIVFTSRYENYEPKANFVYHLSTNSVEEIGDEVRVYSPSSEQYVVIPKSEYSADGNYVPLGVTFINVKTKKERTIKAEIGPTVPKNPDIEFSSDYTPFKTVIDVVWIDEKKVILTLQLGSFENGVYQPGQGTEYAFADLSSTISVIKAKTISIDVACCDSDGISNIYDTVTVNGKTYILTTYVIHKDKINSVGDEESMRLLEIRVYDISDESLVFKIDSATLTNDTQYVKDLSFGSTQNQIFGSIEDPYIDLGFAFDNATNTFIKPSGSEFLRSK